MYIYVLNSGIIRAVKAVIKKIRTSFLSFFNSFISHEIFFFLSLFFIIIMLRPPTQIIVSLPSYLFHAADDSDVCVESNFNEALAYKTIITRALNCWLP